MRKLMLTVCAAVAFAAAASQPCRAEEPDEPLLAQLQETFKKKYLSVSMLVQIVFDAQIDRNLAGENGFSVANFRIALRGELDSGFGYFVQTNYLRSPAILDAKAYYRVGPGFIVDFGQFKSTFSKEFLTGAASIDFVNRSQIVSAFAPNRQIGLQFRSELMNRTLNSALGIFNGNGIASNGNDNEDFMYVGRIAFTPALAGSPDADRQLEIGVNTAYSREANVNVGAGLLPGFSGRRLLAGADVRLTYDGLLLAAEAIYADIEPDVGPAVAPYGFHATAGWMLTDSSQLLFRWDRLESDGLLAGDSVSDLLIVGYNLWPTQATELQVNYIVDPDDADFDHHRLLINAQVAY